MSKKALPAAFLKLLRSVEGKRPKTVIDHILKHGQITSQELKDLYGYNHPPRAIRDVREQGIPIITLRVEGADGRKIAAYTFGDPAAVRATQLSGRTAFSSQLKDALIERHGSRCNIYQEPYSSKELQIDHRIPFEIVGEGDRVSEGIDGFMLLCASANRAKSWSCEHCKNWTVRDADVCRGCYWAFPEDYSHVAMSDVRRLDIMWSGAEIEDYDRVKEAAAEVREQLPTFVKNVLRSHAERNKKK